MKKILVTLMLIASVGAGMPAFAAEPSLHEVYQAANNGKLDDAQRMMKEVLQAHPNSGKAHYVEAELLARQGQLKQAANEMAAAEKLAPGLPFASAQSVADLRQSVTHASSSAPAPRQVQQVSSEIQPAREASGMPWGMLFIGLGLIAFIIWASKFMARQNRPGNVTPSQPEFGGYRPAYPSAPYGGAPQAYGNPAAPPAAGPGFGSQMLGGLATGAAVGAGVVAGEALMHHFMDGHKAAPADNQNFAGIDSIPNLPSTPLDDMGGNDFGIADSSSWDDGAASSDSDWN